MQVVHNPLLNEPQLMVTPNPLARDFNAIGTPVTQAFQVSTQPSQTYSLYKGQTNMNTNITVASILDSNKAALKAAARAEVGRIAINTIVDALKPQLPMMVRGYADHALFKIAIANAVGLAIQKFLPTNAKAQLIADAMLVSSHTQLLQSFDLEGLINGLISKLPVDKMTALEEGAA